MEKGDNLDLVLDATGENVEVQTSESPTTSANAKKQTDSKLDDLTQDRTGNATIDCPICLQPCVYPARLPCGHIFCFLCIKGVAYKNQRCAMCRREIPAEFLDRPQLIDENIFKKFSEDGFQWFYEGRNGWWQYDVRTSQDIEDAFKNGEKSCTILVAGYVYTVDLEAMVQQRQNEPNRCRRVKRDLESNISKKGIAGLRLEGTTVALDTDPLGTHSPTEDTNVNVPRQSRDFLSPNATNHNLDLAASVEMPTVNQFDHSNNFVQENDENFFSNTVQNNSYESEHRPDDEFQETLTNLQQLTLRASDALNSTQNESSDDGENRYRNIRS